MLNRCENCGGTLLYDVRAGQLKCQHCDSFFDPDEFAAKTDAEERIGSDEYQIGVFTCPACGAEISSTDLDAVNYCLYCGNFVTLDRNMKKMRKPDYIIPFHNTIEDCKRNYRLGLRDRIYGRKEFRDEKFLEGFKGIYIPYWEKEVSVGPELHLKKTNVKTTQKIDYVTTNKIDGEVECVYSYGTYDASSTFDDQLGDEIRPFNYKTRKPFNPSYMFGFFGDTADVPSEVYFEKEKPDAVFKEVADRVMTNETVNKVKPDRLYSFADADAFSIKQEEKLCMMPVWFLTWKRGRKVAYSAMNGVTGKMHTEVPISILKYLLISLLTAVPIFFLLNMNFTFMGHTIAKMAMVLSAFTIVLNNFQLEKIVRRKKHFDDEGYISQHPWEKMEREKHGESLLSMVINDCKNVFKENGVIGTLLAMIVLFFAGILAGGVGILAVIALVMATPIYVLYRFFKCMKVLRDPLVFLDIAGALGAMFLSAWLILADPAADEFFYICGVISLAGVALTAAATMRRYNELITRPVPHFYNREKGGKA